MKTIFAELYNRIMDFFQGDKGEQTSQCAANRLQVILMHDRTKLDSATMAKMREELIGVFSKYVIIDNDELEIGLKSEGDSVALMLNIPIIRAKTEEELQEALKEEERADENAEETKAEGEVSDDKTTGENEENTETVQETEKNSDENHDEIVEEPSESEEEIIQEEKENHKKSNKNGNK